MGRSLRRSGLALLLWIAAVPAFAQAVSPVPPANPPGTAPGAPAPPAAGPRITLSEPVLTCRTLSELLLWDNKDTDGEVLRRTIAERTCRNLPGGTAVSIAERATIKGTAYQCLTVDGEGDCLWAGAVAR
ncbi:MAG TPA: hypothetical protein VHL98_00465 [Microvirga sp.]|jgi:hypothetical protein|nr:hypothetical protein [Microvirga sp.]